MLFLTAAVAAALTPSDHGLRARGERDAGDNAGMREPEPDTHDATHQAKTTRVSWCSLHLSAGPCARRCSGNACGFRRVRAAGLEPLRIHDLRRVLRLSF